MLEGENSRSISMFVAMSIVGCNGNGESLVGRGDYIKPKGKGIRKTFNTHLCFGEAEEESTLRLKGRLIDMKRQYSGTELSRCYIRSRQGRAFQWRSQTSAGTILFGRATRYITIVAVYHPSKLIHRFIASLPTLAT
jgi:hypothetical protein